MGRAIAYLRGCELDDPHTQAMIMLTVAGNGAQAVLSELGVVIGKQAAKQAITAVPMTVNRKINQKPASFSSPYTARKDLLSLSPR